MPIYVVHNKNGFYIVKANHEDDADNHITNSTIMRNINRIDTRGAHIAMIDLGDKFLGYVDNTPKRAMVKYSMDILVPATHKTEFLDALQHTACIIDYELKSLVNIEVDEDNQRLPNKEKT